MTEVIIFINGDEHKLGAEEVKVEELLVLAGYNTNEYELQKRKHAGGPVEETFSDPSAVIKVQNNDYFTTRFKGSINPA